MSTTPIRVLIVDDEPPARRKIARFLAQDPWVSVVGEAGNGRQAIEAIRTLDPQVVFLDIQMPGVDGFGVLEALDPDEMPEIVFVTAHDQYAVQAFEVAALDYLLKPFDAERFWLALGRAKERVLAAGRSDHDAALPQKIRELLQQMHLSSTGTDRILVKGHGRSYFVELAEIQWIRGAGNYAELHTSEGKHLVRETLDGISQRLDPRRFVRIHRSYVVNIDMVQEIEALSHGDHLLRMKDGEELRLSRRYRDRLPAGFLEAL